jgi:sigma-B regulation protein RsbU (phosphoserine phosphatase)
MPAFAGRYRLRLPLFFLAIATLLLAIAPPRADAQVFDATSLREPTFLENGWLVHAGDDPAYARTDFDDSTWAVFDSRKSIHEVLNGPRPEFIWYRLHIKVMPDQRGLALEEWYLGSAFEIYANGQSLLKVGKLEPLVPYQVLARPVVLLPQSDVATGSVVLAVRTRTTPSEWNLHYAGLYYTNLILGQQHELNDQVLLHEIGTHAADWVNRLFGLGLGVVALALFLTHRERREYLWIFLYTLVLFLYVPWRIFEDTQTFPIYWEMLNFGLGFSAELFFILLYLAFLRQRFATWLKILFTSIAVFVFFEFLGLYIFHFATAGSNVLARFAEDFVEGFVLPFLAINAWRKGNREAGILLIPLLLFSISDYVTVILYSLALIPSLYDWANAASVPIFNHPFGPFTLGLGNLSALLFNLSLTIIIVLRSTRASRQQALLEGEVAAAREVQQVILPEQVEAVPGFKVETAYLPAQQVGGDFFQILPAGDGALLIVVGDVAGKGLPAAMLVSVLVGAVRGVAEYTKAPAELLANLNERLIGRTHGGFSTALVAHIAADGTTTIANAGHLSPYLDGVEISLPGALPLGIVSGTKYETMQVQLEPGSRLTFYSDGVVEAQKPDGELFGFDRAKAISTQPAGAIVEAAKEFGQEDDITVITIERSAVIAAAA